MTSLAKPNISVARDRAASGVIVSSLGQSSPVSATLCGFGDIRLDATGAGRFSGVKKLVTGVGFAGLLLLVT
jgi:hypothetical protein